MEQNFPGGTLKKYFEAGRCIFKHIVGHIAAKV